MIKTAAALLLAGALLTSTSARAGDVWSNGALEKFDTIKIIVTDNVQDGCLPNAGAIQTTLELEALRSGIKVRPNYAEEELQRAHDDTLSRASAIAEELKTATGERLELLERERDNYR